MLEAYKRTHGIHEIQHIQPKTLKKLPGTLAANEILIGIMNIKWIVPLDLPCFSSQWALALKHLLLCHCLTGENMLFK